jgi:hypothetical protein
MKNYIVTLLLLNVPSIFPPLSQIDRATGMHSIGSMVGLVIASCILNIASARVFVPGS